MKLIISVELYISRTLCHFQSDIRFKHDNYCVKNVSAPLYRLEVCTSRDLFILLEILRFLHLKRDEYIFECWRKKESENSAKSVSDITKSAITCIS